jgi:hypothetical protein
MIILGSYGHLNVLGSLAPCLMNYPMFKPVGYAMALGWEEAIKKEATRKEVTVLAENISRELELSNSPAKG